MKTSTLTLLLEIAGVLHLGLIAAGAMMPRAVHLREHLKPMPEFIRRLFWVYYVFIGLCLVSFGVLTVAFAPALASGAALPRAVCLFLTAFWTSRLLAATFVFDVRPYLVNHYLRLGYHATNVAFVYLPVVYASAAFEGSNAMKIAITGGTGFVGRSIARMLLSEGHEVVLIARGQDQTCPSIQRWANARFIAASVGETDKLAAAFAGCQAVAHCAGLNRELGAQTYQKVHIDGTRHVVEAARRAGVRKIALISFLRARPDGGSGYHTSKWAAEEIVRNSGLDYTVFKCGVIYGSGDHLLHHLSRAFHTFPVFAFVGFTDKLIRPVAVADIARLVKASLIDGALSHKTAAVMGPETLTLRGAVRRVARVVGRRALMFPLPVWFHYALGWLVEKAMVTPLVSTAQVRMLTEGLAEASQPCEVLSAELAPKIPFSEEQIRQGLPAPGPFTWRDLRWCDSRMRARHAHPARVFFELP